VIEVDVRQEQGRRARAAERLQQRLLARLRPGIDEHPVNLKARDDLLPTAMADVDLPHRPRRLRQNHLQ
jgi:hypothetical protein